MTVDACMKRWLEEELRGSVKAFTYQTYLNLYRRHILPPRLGGLLLSVGMRYAQEEGFLVRNSCRKLRFSQDGAQP